MRRAKLIHPYLNNRRDETRANGGVLKIALTRFDVRNRPWTTIMTGPGLMTHVVVALLGGALAFSAITAFAAVVTFHLATRLFISDDHD
jgi:hypothetical protein